MADLRHAVVWTVMRTNRIATASVLMCLLVTVAQAGPRAKRETGAVALTTAALAGGGAELVKKVQKAKAATPVFQESAEDKGWRVHYSLAVPHALPSSEITLKVSDVTQPRRPKQPVCSFHKVVYSEAAVTRGNFLLTRDEVLSPNAQLLLEIESDGQVIARQTFQIRGEGGGRTKTISFAEDEESDDEDEGERTADVRNRRR